MADNGVVANPTYMADIRFFFRAEDIQHMAGIGIDLSTYAGVKKDAVTVYFRTEPPGGDMPPDAAGKWSTARSQTFKNWIVNGMPLGTATGETPGDGGAEAAPDRVRKDVTTLSAQEIDTLKTAFAGLMKLDPDQPGSYFAIAGVHGRPMMACLHHEPRFNPWHRVYMNVFEDALRSVEGCENVTMPYWDLMTPLPDVLGEGPFGSYRLPRNVPGMPPNYVTKRNDAATIARNLQDYAVAFQLTTSLQQSLWGDFNVGGYQKWSIQVHDNGHDSIGPTMRNQDYASYDPVFWFFHCNIDRLWLSWQTKVGATTLQGFKSTLTGETTFLDPPFNVLPPYSDPPFSTTADETIAYGIGYDKLVTVEEAAPLENKVGSVEARRSFALKRSSPISVRVKNIDRLSIPGTFVVHLLADGQPVAKNAFFQPNEPRECANCVKHGLVNIDFRMDPEQILDKTLSVEIEVPGRKDIGDRFPLSRAGNPTINARLLLDDE